MGRLAGVAAAVLVMAAGGQASVWAQGGKTTTYPVVPLKVEVASASIPGDPGIWGDELGPYENGAADGTTANIDKYGNLIIAFGRIVRFAFADPVPPGDSNVRAVSGDYITYISTLANGVALQNIALGGQHCIRLNWSYEIPGGYFRLGFHRGFDLNAPDGTSYAVVTRLDPDNWALEPKAETECRTFANGTFATNTFKNPDSHASVFTQVMQKGKWVVAKYGTYVLPFRLTLTRQTLP